MAVRSRTVVRASVLSGSALAMVLVLGCNPGETTPVKEVKTDQKPGESKSPEIPKPSPTGPHPKAVVDNLVHDFGTMEQGGESAHKFVIRNEGQAPLELQAGETTCQCTIGKLDRGVVQPGESTEVELTWHIKSPGPSFSHSALIRSNDPEHTEIRLRIRGWVGHLLGVSPAGDWHFGKVKDEGVHEVSGVVYSDLVDDFEILKIEASSPLLTAEWTKLSAEDLEGIRTPAPPEETAAPAPDTEPQTGNKEKEGEEGEKEEAKKKEDESNEPTVPPPPRCGYRITAKLAPGCPLGNFREELTVVTNAEKKTTTAEKDATKEKDDTKEKEATKEATKTIYIGGQRPGPVQIIGVGGMFWYAPEMVLKMGQFPASTGMSGTISIFIDDIPDGLTVTVGESRPPMVKAELQKDEKFQKGEKFQGVNRVHYWLKVTIPPGAEPAACNAQNLGRISLKTNHPKAETIPINLQFVSY